MPADKLFRTAVCFDTDMYSSLHQGNEVERRPRFRANDTTRVVFGITYSKMDHPDAWYVVAPEARSVNRNRNGSADDFDSWGISSRRPKWHEVLVDVHDTLTSLSCKKHTPPHPYPSSG